MARPSSLTPELRERIELDLSDGVPIVVIAQRVGVGKSTLHEWLSSGRVVRRRRPDPLKLVAESPARKGTSDSDLEERLRAAEPGLVAAIVNAAQRGSWQSAAWLLERIAPERWAKPTRPRPIAEPEIRSNSPFAEVFELAAARRRKLGR